MYNIRILILIAYTGEVHNNNLSFSELLYIYNFM